MEYRPARRLSLAGSFLIIDVPYEDRGWTSTLPGVRLNKRRARFEIPVRPENVRAVVHHLPGIAVDPEVLHEALRIYNAEKAVQEAKFAGWKGSTPIEPMPIKPGIKPFDHQVLGYNVGMQLPNVALLMEQGCGKTLTSIAIQGRRFQRGEIRKVLVVAPSSVVPVWPREYDDYADIPYEVRALIGDMEKRVKLLKGWEYRPGVLQIAVVNYEAVWRDDLFVAICQWNPDLIVCDESQRIKTPGSKQSKAMHKLGLRVAYRHILSGTPITQNPGDYFSQYKFLDPSIFGTSHTAFMARYADADPFIPGKYTWKLMDELVQKAHAIAYRVTKAECLDLPDMIDQIRYCEITGPAWTAYKRIRKDSVAELVDGEVITAQNVLTRLLRLQQITGGFVGDDDGRLHAISDAKLKLLEEVLEELVEAKADRKIVVFGKFTEELRAIEAVVKKVGLTFDTIDGSVPIDDRGAIVKRFQEVEDPRVLVCQTRASGLGITLTRADVAIFYSLDFSFADYDQARCRIHRIGQSLPCTYIHLLARGTVDEHILDVLKAKKSVADDVVDNWREYLKEVA